MNNIFKTINKVRREVINSDFINNVFIAGGFVRDTVMYKSTGNTNDVDIVVNGLGGGIMLAKYLYKKGLSEHAPVIFKRFGTAQLMIDGIQYEFVGTRKEVYNNKTRNPKVFAGTIEDDIKRRDFTINAMLYDLTKQNIIDIVGGKEDIANKIIRTTSTPSIIFNEDPLRILRAIRFAAKLNFAIEDKTYTCLVEAVKQCKLLTISKERIRDEFVKILLLKNFRYGFQLLIKTGAINFILPKLVGLIGLEQPKKHHTDDAFGHTMNVIQNTEHNFEHRLAALLHDIGKKETYHKNSEGTIHFYGHDRLSAKIAREFLIEFKFSNAQIDIIEFAIDRHMSWCNDITISGIRRLYLSHGFEYVKFALELARADVFGRNSKRLTIVDNFYTMLVNIDLNEKNKLVLPIDGRDVMERYLLKPSKKIGEVIGIAKDLFLEDITIEKEQLLLKLDVLVITTLGN